MRATLTIASAVALGLFVSMLPLSTGQAADTPSADQIINSLTPTPGGSMLTRGIRPAGQPPAQAGPVGAEKLAPEKFAPDKFAPEKFAPASGTAGMRPPPPPMAMAKAPEANLTVPFASGSAMISPGAARVLDILGEALTSPRLADFRFRVEGHTDTVGWPETNRMLSQQRAASVVEYLTSRFGIHPSRLMPVGMGEDGLLIETGPQVSMAANRRVLVVNLGR